MNDLLVLIPSRGRPENALALTASWRSAADVLFVLDDDDPTAALYPEPKESGPRVGAGMVGALNRAAVAHCWEYRYLGFMGDDHRPHDDWVTPVVAELARLGTGLVYGDDLFQHQNLPTAVFMTADIVRTLGYMAPPCLQHLAVDDAWLALGRGLGAITYLPDVIIEHLHPFAGKAPMDAGYERVNATWLYDRDLTEFTHWRDYGGLTKAVAALRGAP